MRLPGKIVLRPNDFSQPDFSVIYKDPDGRKKAGTVPLQLTAGKTSVRKGVAYV
jgi:hypothetical protein